MKRKKATAPKKKMKMLHVATLLPSDAQDLYTHCLASWNAIKADKVHFATPYPPATEVDPDLAALNTALEAGPGGGSAETAAIVVAASKVRQDFARIAPYVEGILRAGPIEDAPAILANVLMYESNLGKRAPKPPLAAKHGATPGIVLLVALAMAGVTAYFWEVSVDQVTWSVGAQSSQARSSIAGLTPGKLYWFRVRGLKRDGTMTAYTQAVSLTVV